MSEDDLRGRLIDLQTRIAYQEDALEKLDAVVTDQQARLAALGAAVDRLRARLETLGAAAAPAPDDDQVPPHY